LPVAPKYPFANTLDSKMIIKVDFEAFYALISCNVFLVSFVASLFTSCSIKSVASSLKEDDQAVLKERNNE